MSNLTPNLNLFKYDVNTDTNVPFSITEALNNNWDIIDEKCTSSGLDGKISNCILEVPQRIKLELKDGVLTLKAGSQTIVPNGFETDGVTPKFDYVDVESDISYAWSSSESYPNCYWFFEKNKILPIGSNINVVSGSTQPTVTTQTAIWYDTTNNLIKGTSDRGSTWVINNTSLPIGIASLGNNAVTSIDQVFNGMGFIGQHTWVDKDLRVLFADGRNSDGSLKNIAVKSDNISIWDLTNQYSQLGVLRVVNGQLVLSGYGPNTYFEQEIQPTGFSSYALWYNTRDNCFYDTGDGGSHWTKRNYICIPKLYKSSPTDSISAISMPYTLKIADMNDIMNKMQMPAFKSAYGYTRLTNGIIIQWGQYTTGSDGETRWVTFPTTFSNTDYTAMVTQTSMGTDWYNAWYYAVSSKGATGMNVYARLNGCSFNWMAIGY